MSVAFSDEVWQFEGVRPRFPMELEPPPDFDPDDLGTWPDIDGRLEYVDGRLLYMPPCADLQSATVSDVTGCLHVWRRDHPEFASGTNEAGLALGKDKRGADAIVWRKADPRVHSVGFVREPPILAVEVSGRDEDEATLRKKARWYLKHDVRVVWLLLVETREVIVVTRSGESRHRIGERLPEHADLPGLAPLVDELFEQISTGQVEGA